MWFAAATTETRVGRSASPYCRDTEGLKCMAGDVGSTVQSRHDEYLAGCHVGVRRQVVRQCYDRCEAIVPVPASGQSHEGLARYYGVVPHIGEIRDVQPGA